MKLPHWWPIVAFILLMLAGLALTGVAYERQETKFNAACTALGGKPVYDGRHYVCLGINSSSLN